MARRKNRALDGPGEHGRLSIDAKALSPGGIASGCQAGVVGFKMALLTFQNGRRLFVRCRNLNAAKSLFVFFTFRVTASRCLRPCATPKLHDSAPRTLFDSDTEHHTAGRYSEV